LSGDKTSSAAFGWLRGIGLLVAGMVMGAAAFMLVYQENFGTLVAENNVLRTEKLKLTEDIDQLRRNQKNFSIVRRIDAHLQSDAGSTPLPAEVQEELEKRVRDELKVVYGTKIEIAKDSAPVYDRLISSKTYTGVLDKTYAVDVKFFALIGTELTVWFTAKEKHVPPPGTP